jgi:hypothetical protein
MFSPFDGMMSTSQKKALLDEPKDEPTEDRKNDPKAFPDRIRDGDAVERDDVNR